MTIILGTLLATAVSTVILEKIITAFSGLMQNRLQCDNCVRRILRQEQRSISAECAHRSGQPRGHFHTPGHQERGQQYILCTPYGPVAHRLLILSHPPEMCGQIGQQDPALQIVLNAGQDIGADSVEFFFQQISRTGKQSSRLAGEQIHDGSGDIRQDQLRGITDIGVVRRKLPGSLFADGIDAVEDIIQKTSLMLHTFCLDQIIQRITLTKIESLEGSAVPIFFEPHVICGTYHRECISQLCLSGLHQLLFQGCRKCFVSLPVHSLRKWVKRVDIPLKSDCCSQKRFFNSSGLQIHFHNGTFLSIP